MPRPSPADNYVADLLTLVGDPSQTDSLSRGLGRTLIAGPTRPALLELLGEVGAWEHRLAAEATTGSDPIKAAQVQGAVRVLGEVIEAAADAARVPAMPASETLLAELKAADRALLPSELADSLHMSRQAIAQSLSRLLDKGLVRRHEGPKVDNRTVPYELTDLGREMAAASD